MTGPSKSGFMFELVLGLVVLAILLVAEYLHVRKAAIIGPTPTPIVKVVVTTAPGASVTPAATAAPVAGAIGSPAFIYDVPELGVMFAAPGTLKDLNSTTVRLPGDQNLSSVGFATKRLEAAGCSLASAPLGILTYDTDKGGSIVARVKDQNLYYLEPVAGCKAEATLLPLASFKSALSSLVSDVLAPKAAR